MRFPIALVLAMMVAFGGVSAARADDQSDIRSVIEAQTAAISAGDAHAAFGYATPNIQSRFGSSAMFMTMVENGYAALIKPRAFMVEEVMTEGDKAAARAHVVAADGRVYKAVYPLKRLPNGDWRIDGCYMERADGQSL